jgi:hypothetical protein
MTRPAARLLAAGLIAYGSTLLVRPDTPAQIFGGSSGQP